MSEPRDELADVVSSGGEDFGAFAGSRWPELVRQAYELTGDQAAAADLAQAALTRTSLAWWRISRAGDPDEGVRRALLRGQPAQQGRPGQPVRPGQLSGSNANGLWQAACGPISTPEGPSTIVVLPLGSPHPGVVGVGYVVSVGSATDHLTAELSDGSNVSARPLVVDGRKYAAFFVPGALRIFWLNWIDASGRPIAGFTGLPGYGYIQFSPDGVADED